MHCARFSSPVFLNVLGLAVLMACGSTAAPGGTAVAGASGTGVPVTESKAGSGGATAAGGAGPAAGTGGVAGVVGTSAGNAGTATIPQGCDSDGAVVISVEWDAINEQPAAFYATPEARTLAGNVLYYQNADHGWPKNIDMTSRATAKAGSTIDNRATTTQIEFLARVYGATSCPQFRDAATDGVEFLLAAQYENGGWPQVFPNPSDYHKHITFNDDAMIHVLQVLRALALGKAPYEFADAALKATASTAIAKGIDCILACQISMDGGQRGWCAQHDEVTLAPAQARTYELPSVSGSEGAQIVRFLMTIDPPTPEIRAAVEGAVAWFEAVKLEGIRVEATVDASQASGEDRVVVDDPNAKPLWARFYELGTNRPIFSSRCEVEQCKTDPFYMRRYSLAEIENERRVGYAWYGDWPAAALSEYQAWKSKYPAP